MAEVDIRNACPDCGAKGRKVKRITPECLLVPAAKKRLETAGVLRFCNSESCEVVYFGDGPGSRFTIDEVTVPVFQKSKDPLRLVCHCFHHSVQSIYDEVAETGESKVPESIAEKCKAGLDRCEQTNPQGSCCLGNVRRVVKDATIKTGSTPFEQTEGRTADCCAPSAEDLQPAPSPQRIGNAGIWSTAGAVVTAVLSSACCWLPLMFLAFGASTVGIAGFFEEYRALLLGVTVLLLGVGFYFIYFRKPKCAPGEVCALPNPRIVRLNKITLWVATAFVVAFAAFPQYVGLFFGAGDESQPQIVLATETRDFDIIGMTCKGCEQSVRAALREVPGVVSVDVSYAERSVRVQVTEDVQEQAIVAAVQKLGYKLSAKPTS